MPFDLASAQPVGGGAAGFDLSTAVPVKKPVRTLDRLADGSVAPSGSPAAQEDRDPAMNMSALGRFGAGYGKAGVDLARGAGQLVGAVSRQDVQDARDRDASLMRTGAGRVGNLAGSVADLLPAAFLPGANTLAGAAAYGAAAGLLQPSTSAGEAASNVGWGAAGGPASLLAGRTLGAVGKGAKAALWDPFTQPGQQRIAANVLQSFAGGPKDAQAAAQALQSAPSVLPGVTPTTAELAGNAGLAQLQKTLSSNPALMQDFAQRAQGNRAAMVDSLGRIAGTPQDLAYATHQRSLLSSPLYDQAAQTVAPANADLGKLLARPSMAQAWTRAQQLAAERGESLTQPTANDISGRTLQYLKMGLNDIANSGPQMGMGAHEVQAVKSTLADFNKWTMQNVPQLRVADRAYADLSRPINQMEVGTQLAQKLQPALTDFGQNTRLNANQFATGVRNGDAIAADVTGRQGAALSDILNASQMRTIRQIGEQLARSANAAELGAPKGSPTAQNLISQNVLGQFLGPLGLPNNMAGRIAGGALGRTMGRVVQFPLNAAEPDVMRALSQAALDPTVARQMLTATQRPGIGRVLWNRQGLLGPVGGLAARGLLGNSSEQ